MIRKDNIQRVLEVFFDNPLPIGTGFQLREISRLIKLAPKSVKIYLDELEKEQLIIMKQHRIHKFPVYFANRDHEYFKFLKKINLMIRIKESGLLNYLSEQSMPEVIILFGSAARGEDVAESDIDLYLQCDIRKLELIKYQEILMRKINIFFEKNFNKLSEELKDNIINGIKLAGYLRIQWKKG